MAKSTDAEIDLRVTMVYSLLLRSWSRIEIVRYAAKNWQVESRIVDTYISRARRLIKKQAKADRVNELGQARARLNLLFGSAFEIGDFRTCLAVQRELNALADLYPAERLLQSSYVEFSPEMLETLKEFNVEPNAVIQEFLALLRAKKVSP